ncbi:Pseudouridine-5'-phosphatase [Oleoguttula sp. CCFEE 5521]
MVDDSVEPGIVPIIRVNSVGVDDNSVLQSVDTRRAHTPAQYVDRVRAHSDRSKERCLYPGLNYRHFAQFIGPTESTSATVSATSQDSGFSFCIIHTFGPDGSHAVVEHDAHDGHQDLLNAPLPDTGGSHVVFMRGFPSITWLSCLGAHRRVDPEFFRRHMDFLQPSGHVDGRPLPSSTMNLIQLRVTTIYSRSPLSTRSLTQAREREMEALKRYQKRLREKARAGESIVRRISNLDETAFSIEQSVSISVVPRKGKGFTVLVWLDMGRSLQAGPHGPWSGDSSSMPNTNAACEPIISHRPKLALERQRSPIVLEASADRLAQNVCHLASQYGYSQDAKLMAGDAIYSVNELFHFAANSKRQLFNLIEHSIRRASESGYQGTQESLEDLTYLKSRLDDETEYLRDILDRLLHADDARWPSADPSATREVLRHLEYDHDHLLKRAETLAARCMQGINTVTNAAMHKEARKGIDQAEQTKRLTILAFLLLPLSITTSLFGMNFKEFGTGRLSIWTWVVVLIPVVGMSLVLCYWNLMPSWRSPRKQFTAAEDET